MKEEFKKENYYTKTIGIAPKQLEWIKETKGKKSAAGRLNEIIEFYKKNSGLESLVIVRENISKLENPLRNLIK